MFPGAAGYIIMMEMNEAFMDGMYTTEVVPS
jgi:hypothetical protein